MIYPRSGVGGGGWQRSKSYREPERSTATLPWAPQVSPPPEDIDHKPGWAEEQLIAFQAGALVQVVP